MASPDGAYTTINSVELDYGNDNLISIGETINLEIEVENIGSETLYFIISALNQLNIDRLRNNILLKVLPLKV